VKVVHYFFITICAACDSGGMVISTKIENRKTWNGYRINGIKSGLTGLVDIYIVQSTINPNFIRTYPVNPVKLFS